MNFENKISRYSMEESIKERTYEETKTEFEKHVCRIDDVLLYPVKDAKNERTLYTFTPTEGAVAPEIFGRKTEHKFVPEWADDPNKNVQEDGKLCRRTALPMYTTYGKDLI